MNHFIVASYSNYPEGPGIEDIFILEKAEWFILWKGEGLESNSYISLMYNFTYCNEVFSILTFCRDM